MKIYFNEKKIKIYDRVIKIEKRERVGCQYSDNN